MRRTRNTLAILSALDAERWFYGGQVVAKTSIDTGSVARVLRRFEDAGLAESREESAEEARDGFTPSVWQRTFDGFAGQGRARARRRFYRLTPAGIKLRREWADPERR